MFQFCFRAIAIVIFTFTLASSLDEVQAGEPTVGKDGPVEPYVVYVARDGEYTRCGPSGEYYKADPLAPGQDVDVYLETDDGWLGIRPPDNSFCWLQSDQVEVADDQSRGTIVEASAVVWIGTHLGKARQYRWQIRLQQDEEVTIIGTAKRAGPEGDEVWYRIVPPAGEFRWLHRSQVVNSRAEVSFQPRSQSISDDALTPVVANPRSSSQQIASRESATTEVAPKPSNEEMPLTPPQPPADSLAFASPSPSTQDAIDPLDDQPIGSGVAASDDTKGSSWVSFGEVRTVSGSEWSQSGSPVSAASFEQPALTRSGYVAPAELSTLNIDALGIELSRAMVAGATAAEAEPIRERVVQIADSSPNSVSKGRASLLLKRIDEYQRVARKRHEQNLGPASTSATTSASLAPSVPVNIGVDAGTGERTQFDRQGWLVKVYSARPSAPPYAIVDSAGQTLSYVTPVPGINLRRYLNQEVGLYGRVAFDTSLETPHLIAEQAVRVRR